MTPEWGMGKHRGAFDRLYYGPVGAGVALASSSR